MGQRGPKPLPDNVHRLNGNPSKKRLGAVGAGTDVPVEVPDAPEHLNKAALAEWNRISSELYKLGLIAKIDRAMLGAYCQAFARWAEAELKIAELGEEGLVQKSPNGYLQYSVWLQISNRAQEQMKTFGVEFGMTPSARVRVNPNPQMGLFDDGEESGNDKNQGKAKGKSARSPESYFTK
ncbi:MAG: phage terminase small subunit P27 family [Spongiibacteraceae bacterium]|uniref:phage terminase small subunit P27 family n=1 Tax=uncultured Haliea sp. TaxID=622616 RepID=UPI000C607828|nr:phage terminase small subunit P27 family [Spongiibacteraceae bacterium]|tara:strand:+ start:13967 stop:14506 length:540 start_codon:yes stop_codon:yes gene_type:complete